MARERSANFDDNDFYQRADAFFSQHKGTALTYDDVSLATNYSEILPKEANLESRLSERISLNIPIISSDMDTVTEYGMAIAMASSGGMGIIHYNMPYKEQVSQVTRVKYHINGLLPNPITVTPDIYIGDVIELIEEKGYKFRTFPVTDENGTLAGLLGSRVVKARYSHIKVAEAMDHVSKVLTLNEAVVKPNPIDVADKFFSEHLGINKLLVVDDANRLKGLVSISDIERIMSESQSVLKPARDSDFRLLVGAAISTVWKEDGTLDRDAIVEHVTNLCNERVDVWKRRRIPGRARSRRY